PALIGEVEAVVLIAVGRSVVEIEALRVEVAAGMIVDKIEDDGDAMQVREIDQAFQLIDARPKLFEGQRLGAKLGERRVDLPKIAREIRVVAHLVALLQGLNLASRQQTNARRPSRRSARRRFEKARTGSAKNMTPKRETTTSAARGARREFINRRVR